MTRIVAGDLRGRTLHVPPRGTRPTSERVREALFAALEHRDAVAGLQVLDLYAGSGALGLEAASRGAAHVTLVDAARGAADVCRRNVRELGLSARARVVVEPAERFVARQPAGRFGLALLDLGRVDLDRRRLRRSRQQRRRENHTRRATSCRKILHFLDPL